MINPTIIKIFNCSFLHSLAQFSGGAIFLYNLNKYYTIIYLEQINFFNSSASNGGAIYLENILN